MRSIRWTVAVLVLAIAAGCNSSVETGASSTGGTGGTGGSGASGPGGTSGGTGGIVFGTTGTGGVTCPGFEDDEDGPESVTVRFRNDTGVTIFMPGQCDKSIKYTIDPLGGYAGVSYVFDTFCSQTCADLQQAPSFSCAACPQAVYRMDPGETRDAVWQGNGLNWGIMMPVTCFAGSGSGGVCDRIVPAAEGAYLASASAFDGCEGDCACDGAGPCSGHLAGAKASSDVAELSFPSDSLVEVVFGPCAFGCP